MSGSGSNSRKLCYGEIGGNEALLLWGSWRGLRELDNASAACIMHAPLQSLQTLGKAMAVFCKCFGSGCIEDYLKLASSTAAFFSCIPGVLSP